MRAREIAAIRAGAYVMGVLPRRVGQFRLAQWYWWRRRPSHRVLRQQMADGTSLELDLGDRTQALAFLTRRYAEKLIRQIVAQLPRSGLFFDVGANAGLVTFQVAHRRPDVRIVAFEPNPAAAAAWRRNWRLTSTPSVTFEPTAVTDASGFAILDAPECDLGAGTIATGANSLEIRTVRRETYEVPTLTLDDYCAANGIGRIDVVKVDVQGGEPDVLRGARHLLNARAIRYLILEFDEPALARRGLSREAMLDLVADHGMVPAGPVDIQDVAFTPAGREPASWH